MLYPIELRAPTPVTTAEAALGLRDDALAAHRFAVPETTRDKKPSQGESVRRGADRAAIEDLYEKAATTNAAADGRYKTRTCDLHDVNVAL
jgi:hypothetical protein